MDNMAWITRKEKGGEKLFKIRTELLLQIPFLYERRRRRRRVGDLCRTSVGTDGGKLLVGKRYVSADEEGSGMNYLWSRRRGRQRVRGES